MKIPKARYSHCCEPEKYINKHRGSHSEGNAFPCMNLFECVHQSTLGEMIYMPYTFTARISRAERSGRKNEGKTFS